MKTLQCGISNTELLELYGYEPYQKTNNIAARWHELSRHWTIASAVELGNLRQTMLLIHLDLYPDDKRWV